MATKKAFADKDMCVAGVASKEDNPLYPVSVLMDAKAPEEIYRNVSERI